MSLLKSPCNCHLSYPTPVIPLTLLSHIFHTSPIVAAQECAKNFSNIWHALICSMDYLKIQSYFQCIHQSYLGHKQAAISGRIPSMGMQQKFRKEFLKNKCKIFTNFYPHVHNYRRHGYNSRNLLFELYWLYYRKVFSTQSKQLLYVSQYKMIKFCDADASYQH